MATRDERAAEAKKHIALMRQTFANETQASIESAEIFQDGAGRELALPEASYETTEIKVKRSNSAAAICAAQGGVVALDFASFLNPGGGYERGAWAQEEALCSESNLYPILEGLKEAYYDKNRGYTCGQLYTDRAMLVHDVRFNHGGNLRPADIIVLAAPNRPRALENHRSEAECDAEMARRVETAMRLAAYSGKPTVVLGAFGCGVFGNDPTVVATLFKNWLDEHPGIFETVIFPIPGGPNLEAFDEVFGTGKPAVEQPVVTEDADEDEEEEWAEGLEQSEEGRWVFD